MQKMLLFNLSQCHKSTWNLGLQSSSVGPPPTLPNRPCREPTFRFLSPCTESQGDPACLPIPASCQHGTHERLRGTQLSCSMSVLLCASASPGRLDLVGIQRSLSDGCSFPRTLPQTFSSDRTIVAPLFVHRDLGFSLSGRNSPLEMFCLTRLALMYPSVFESHLQKVPRKQLVVYMVFQNLDLWSQFRRCFYFILSLSCYIRKTT